ncbi:MAG TPA: ABC transporter permease subunit [Thermoanaerobaculia bacterium]|nr:ABC transporter permease subunit [Thermoanaerobaculia bacterium]
MRRRLLDGVFSGWAAACAALGLALVVGVVGLVLVRAAPAVSLELVLAPSQGAGAEGGLRYQLLGTLVLAAMALAVCTPLATALALLQTTFLPPGAARALGVALACWNGLPSVALGIFGFALFTQELGWGKSWLAGGVVLGMLITPTAAGALAARIQAIPARLIESARGLGLTRSQVAWAVQLRLGARGLVAGLLLGLARAVGETAPILFTAAVFSGATLPRGIVESPILALPYHIFVLAQDLPSPEARERLWAAALLLLGVVACFAAIALRLRLGDREEGQHAG